MQRKFERYYICQPLAFTAFRNETVQGMKILLINPPRSPQNKILEYAPADAKHFIHKKLIGPPLGLLTIAAAVKDFDVRVIDLKGEYDLHPEAPDLKDQVIASLEEFNPEIVGVTFIASEFYYGMDIFRTVKLFNSGIYLYKITNWKTHKRCWGKIIKEN